MVTTLLCIVSLPGHHLGALQWGFLLNRYAWCCPTSMLYFPFYYLLSEAGTRRSLFSFESDDLAQLVQLCLTLWDPMNRSTPGLPVYHQLPEFTQTHVHQVGDAIQTAHPLPSPSPPTSNPSQHQGLFQWVNPSHEVAKLLEFQLQQNTQDWSPLGWTGWISLQSKGLSRVFSNTTVQKHEFFGAQLSSQSNSHIHTWPLEKP